MIAGFSNRHSIIRIGHILEIDHAEISIIETAG
jgi:hypothetical protein